MSGTVPALDIPIVHYHSVHNDRIPALLYAGEVAWVVAPGATRLYVGDGVTNRLVLSTSPLDMPLIDPFAQPVVSDTPPANPFPRQLWCDATTLRLYLLFNGQWVEIARGGQT